MSSPLLSHPDQELKDHLLGVQQLANHFWGDRQVSVWESGLLKGLLTITAFAHDFGKSTKYFQRYITDPNLGLKKGGPYASHALLSAVVGYFMAKEYLGKHPRAGKLSFFVYIAIKRHHGNLHDISDEYASFSDRDRDLLLTQIPAIDYDSLQESWRQLIHKLPPPLNQWPPFSKKMLESWIDSFKGELRQIRKAWFQNISRTTPLFGEERQYVANAEEDADDLQDYFQFLFLYSLLLDADKNQVGVKKYPPAYSQSLAGNLVDNFKERKNWLPAGINSLREEAYREIAGNLPLTDQGKIFSITLPTGLGKTLAAYNFAFKLREKRLQERGAAPKIIYALPFLTVIDQNYQVLTDILGEEGVLTGHHVLTKHHHLTDPKFNVRMDSDELNYQPNAAKLLIEGWASEIVVTTFIQLFETLIGWRNSSLRRFHRLAHAIIIIDEIQAIPVPYWTLAQKALEFLTNHMSTDIILVTATQPKIFTGSSGALELARPEKYFARMDRVKMEINLSRRTVQEFVHGELQEQLLANPNKSFLFILNTISSAKELYRQIERITDEPVGFLSTGVIMKQRRSRIAEIQKKVYRLVVSTQLVEAGVDIDFDIVYRDLAPMDSINQAAGRCNRHALGAGIVRIINLVSDNEKRRPFAHMIYDNVALDITTQILQNRKTIGEREFLHFIDLYFAQARSKTISTESHQLLKAIKQLCFFSDDDTKTSISSFQLIKEKGLRGNVFVELDQEAKELWDQYGDILNIKDFYHRQEKFISIKKAFYDYVISIPLFKLIDLPPEVNHFLYVNNLQLESYYDRCLGYDSKGIDTIF